MKASGYKKGNMTLDSMFVLLLLVSGIVIIPLVFVALEPFLTSLSGADFGLNAKSDNILQSTIDRVPQFLDWSMFFLLLASLALIIISSFLQDSHPIFFWIGLIMYTFLLSAAAILSNFADDFVSTFPSVEQSLPIIYFIGTHVLEFIIVSGCIIAVVLYGKNRFSQPI